VSLPRRTFALLLASTPGIGGRTVTRVLARNDLLSRTPEQFLRLSSEAWREEYKLSAKAATNLLARRKTAVEETLELEDRLSRLDVSWITAADAHYPQRIEEMDPDPPGMLFLYGNIKLLEARTFCVMSSRNAPPAVLDEIERLTEEGVLSAETLVTGHDTPEYQRSAIVPLRWGSPRVLCLDRGLFQALGEDLREEPFRAARLWRYQFDPTTDLVVSPFKPDAGFVGINNQVRDRLIACLSLRLDFCHISPGGNMEKLAKLAIKAGRGIRVSDRCLCYRELRELGAEIIPAS
jgi:predicted Rossmann fold nucleotide-binding protein DprA/Smf involved in DNA uptake